MCCRSFSGIDVDMFQLRKYKQLLVVVVFAYKNLKQKDC